MKAMILAAGLGTRLKPWTLSHPKALVPVDGVPMLERVILRLKEEGFDDIVVNVHHFADQIVDFLATHDYGVRIRVSHEEDCLLDTGGAILHAAPLLDFSTGPVLVHNVDILSDADLRGLMDKHNASGNAATLLVSDRNSSRKLVVDRDMALGGWHNLNEDRFRPEGFRPSQSHKEVAFSGIHVVSGEMADEMVRLGFSGKFPVMDYYLSADRQGRVGCVEQSGLRLIDIGKPETIAVAKSVLEEMKNGMGR